jgi:carboxypeptidase Taq
MRTSFLTHQKKLAHLSHVQALLARDQEAMMPVKAGPWRAEQMGYLATLHHEALLDGAYEKLLDDLLWLDNELEPRQLRSVRLAYKELQQTKRLDVRFVEHFETVKARAQQVRFEARKANDFQLFAPHLEEIISLTRQYATQIEPNKDPYDTLLDIYEEDATQERYDACLLPLQKPLTELLAAASSPKLASTGADWLDTEETKKLLHELSKTVGFDFDAGMLGEVHHPFMTTLGWYDYRINTRYDHPVEAITGMIHELGHGLYEQRVDPKLFYTNLHYGASTWMHESQSRTLENMIGRSKWMSQYLDGLCKKFGKKYTGSATEWYAVCNNVGPSLIRIEADEISYGLHILLRYELEKELIAGRLSVQDLPNAWNEKMITYLGIAPKTDTEWCLQDVHRSCGLFGYFPTYLLGNLYAGQMWTEFSRVYTDWESQIAKGDFTHYFERYKQNVWQRWRELPPRELIRKITRKDVEATDFLAYLQTKFT